MPRRTFLRGAGAALALPLLDAMVPAFTAVARTAAAPQRRLGFVYVPHGAIMTHWTPDTVGAGFDFKSILKPLEGVASLRTVLLAKPEVVVGTMAEKLLTYALGRGLEPSDMPAVRGIVRHAAAQGYRFSALVDGVVRSAPFMMRRAES